MNFWLPEDLITGGMKPGINIPKLAASLFKLGIVLVALDS